jgi:hypothetical protein
MGNPNGPSGESLSFRSALRRAGEAAHASSNEAFKKKMEYESRLLDVHELIATLVRWYESEQLECQTLEFDTGAMVQCRRKGDWRKYLGMNSELTVLVKPEPPKVTVEIGAGKWAAKAGAGAVGLVGALINPLLFVPYLGGVAYGTWEQQRLRQRTIELVEELATRRRPATDEVP